MRFLGVPVHVMLVHFPVALWPAHWVLHIAEKQLPAGTAVHAGFWILVAGTALGWCAAACGFFDLAKIVATGSTTDRRHAWTHAAVNGFVLSGFTVLSALECSRFPLLRSKSTAMLVAEGILLALMIVGNHFGGRLVWGAPAQNTIPPSQKDRAS